MFYNKNQFKLSLQILSLQIQYGGNLKLKKYQIFNNLLQFYFNQYSNLYQIFRAGIPVSMMNQSSKATRVVRTKRQLFSKSSLKFKSSFQSSPPFFLHILPSGQEKLDQIHTQQDTQVSLVEEYQSTDNTAQKYSSSSDNDSSSEYSITHRKSQGLSQQITAIQYENKLLQRLRRINYLEVKGCQLEQIFKNKVSKHIFFKGFRPYAQTLMGANLLTNGIFHELWSHVLKKQQYLSFECLKNKYYEDFKYCIKSNFSNFESSFSQQSFLLSKSQQENMLNNALEMGQLKQQQIKIDDQNKMDQEFRQNIEEVNKCKEENDGQQCNNDNKQNQIDLLFEQLSAPQSQQLKQQSQQEQEQAYPSPRKQIYAQSPIDEQQQYSPTNEKLLAHRQINQRRISAQMACEFFNIDTSHTYSLNDIRIQQVLQMYKHNKFQYAIVMGRKLKKQCKAGDTRVKNIGFEQQCRIFISCYKFINIQQLIRLELTYGKVFGFIAYDKNVDFYGYLKSIIDKSSKHQSKIANSEKRQQSWRQRHPNQEKHEKQQRVMTKQKSNHFQSDNQFDGANQSDGYDKNVLMQRYWKQKLEKKYNFNRASSGSKKHSFL